MRASFLIILLALCLSIFAQAGDLNLQDVKIEGDDNKSADFHLVNRDISEYELIEHPLETRYKYFAPVNEFNAIEDSLLQHKSYSELEIGSASKIHFRTAYKDFERSLLSFSALYDFKDYADDWKISSMQFGWFPAIRDNSFGINLYNQSYELRNDITLSGVKLTADLNQLSKVSSFNELYVSAFFDEYDDGDKETLMSSELITSYNLSPTQELRLNLISKDDYIRYSLADHFSISDMKLSFWIQGDNELLVPTLGWQLPLFDNKLGILSFRNRPNVKVNSFSEDLESYHYLDIASDMKSEYQPVNASLVYGNSQILPLNISLFHKYIVNYGYINPNDYTGFRYEDVNLTGLSLAISYKSKRFKLSNQTIFNYFDYNTLNYQGSVDYTKIPYLSEYENNTSLDINIDKFLFNTLFEYKSNRYSHQNVKLDPMYDLKCYIEYRFKKEISVYLESEHLINTGSSKYSNYEEEPLNIGVGIKVSLR